MAEKRHAIFVKVDEDLYWAVKAAAVEARRPVANYALWALQRALRHDGHDAVDVPHGQDADRADESK